MYNFEANVGTISSGVLNLIFFKKKFMGMVPHSIVLKG
jgi:hypothetical protein